MVFFFFMKAKTSTTCTLSWQRTGSYRARALRLGVRPFSSLPPRVLIHFRFSNDLPTLLQHVEKRRLDACVRGHVISTRQFFVSYAACGMWCAIHGIWRTWQRNQNLMRPLLKMKMTCFKFDDTVRRIAVENSYTHLFCKSTLLYFQQN